MRHDFAIFGTAVATFLLAIFAGIFEGAAHDSSHIGRLVFFYGSLIAIVMVLTSIAVGTIRLSRKDRTPSITSARPSASTFPLILHTKLRCM